MQRGILLKGSMNSRFLIMCSILAQDSVNRLLWRMISRRAQCSGPCAPRPPSRQNRRIPVISPSQLHLPEHDHVVDRT